MSHLSSRLELQNRGRNVMTGYWGAVPPEDLR